MNRIIKAGAALTFVAGLVTLMGSASSISAASPSVPETPTAKVTILRTPDGGLEPQAAVDEHGVLHLVYFKGDPHGGDLYYVRRESGERAFSKPVRINSQPGSTLVVGAVRGAHMAIGRNGLVHVAWMGSKTAEPKGPSGSVPMLYTRLDDSGGNFQEQRNVMQFASGLDGGGSIAADRSGNVYVTWHAGDERQGEARRQVWVARSTDDGTTFERERPAFAKETGACGCCGMRAFADARNHLYLLYRTATQSVHRDMYLLSSSDNGRTFSGQEVQPWKLNACPMTTASIASGGDGALIAWETAGQVYYSHVHTASPSLNPLPAPGSGEKRKHPSLASNEKGETLLAWTEGTGWNKGGSLGWQVFDSQDKPVGEVGHAAGVPVWGVPSAVAMPGGGFIIFY